MLGRRLGITLAFAVLAVLAAPAAAAAATVWYAAPTGQGSGDCSSPVNACPLAIAVTAATSGDTIYVLGNLGDYNLAAGTVNPGSKVLHFVGMNGVPRLIAKTSSPVLELSAVPSSASGLYLENDGSGDGLFVSPVYGSGGFAIDRVFVKTTSDMTTHTCFLGGGVTLTNSVCWQANAASLNGGVATEFTNTMRNVVAWQSGSGTAVQSGAYYGAAHLTIVNTIARATGTGGTDLGAFSSGFTAAITVRHSNFATAVAQGSASMDHFDTDATDQSTMPVLVNPLAGNFRERSSSPTINAGVTAPANGALDLAGHPRTVRGKTDIGAYELGTPLVPPHDTRITKAKIDQREQTATFKFTASGTIKGFQCALTKHKTGTHSMTPKPHFVSCRSPKTYTGLKHGKYTFEVRAVNSAGPDRAPAIKTFRL